MRESVQVNVRFQGHEALETRLGDDSRIYVELLTGKRRKRLRERDLEDLRATVGPAEPFLL